MQRLYKNENLLFKDFKNFLLQKQRIPENRLPYYLRWGSRFHNLFLVRFISLFIVHPEGDVSEHFASKGFVQLARLYRLCSVPSDASPPRRTL